ncbi:MoaD/ThiS family protein [Chloroflexota bacterium]
MNKIRTKIPPHLARMLSAQSSGWLIIDNEVEEGATIGDLLVDLASNYTGFRKGIFNPDAGEVSEQVMVILNDSLLQGQDVVKTRLNDGDSVSLLTVYSGG